MNDYMQDSEKRERVFINSENTATFICPKCQRTRNVNVSKIIGAKKAVKINCRCKCGKEFATILERRRYFRKNIAFNGFCHVGENLLKLPVIVTDISRAGLKIKLQRPHMFTPGEEFLIEFNLDDKDQSLISKKIIIRSVTDKLVGAEFKSPEHYDPLGAYLMYR